jgi:hypothetical protein
MPTMAKLASAILFAALGWITAEAVVRHALEEGTRVGAFREMLAALGLLLGWRYLGGAVTGIPGRGTTIAHAVTAGLAAALALAVIALVLHGFTEMLIVSQDLAYASVGEAVTDMMDIIWNMLLTVAVPTVLYVLFGGGMAVGLLCGLIGRRTT